MTEKAAPTGPAGAGRTRYALLLAGHCDARSRSLCLRKGTAVLGVV